MVANGRSVTIAGRPKSEFQKIRFSARCAEDAFLTCIKSEENPQVSQRNQGPLRRLWSDLASDAPIDQPTASGV